MTQPRESITIATDIHMVLMDHVDVDGYCPRCEGDTAPCIYRRVALFAYSPPLIKVLRKALREACDTLSDAADIIAAENLTDVEEVAEERDRIKRLRAVARRRT